MLQNGTRSIFFFILMLIAMLSSVHAGPFGLDMGMSIKEIEGVLRLYNTDRNIHIDERGNDVVFTVSNLPEELHEMVYMGHRITIDSYGTRTQIFKIEHKVFVSKAAGLYKVQTSGSISSLYLMSLGISAEIYFPHITREKYSSLRNVLKYLYGQGTGQNFLNEERSDILFQRDWAKAIKQGSNIVMYQWRNRELFENDIDLMVLQARAIDATNVTIGLTIEFWNIPQEE